jgi:hypothetical protein
MDSSLWNPIEKEDFLERDDKLLKEWPQSSQKGCWWWRMRGRGRWIPAKPFWSESAEIKSGLGVGGCGSNKEGRRSLGVADRDTATNQSRTDPTAGRK